MGIGLRLKGLLYSLTTLENYSFLLSVGSSEPSFSLKLNCPLSHDSLMLGRLLVGIYFMVLAIPLQKGLERESVEISRQWEVSVYEGREKESLVLKTDN